MFLSHHHHLLRLSPSLKPKTLTLTLTSLLSPKTSSNPLSHFSSSSTSTLLSLPQPALAPIPLSIDKLFVPPDTVISASPDDPPSHRVLKGSNIVLSKYAFGAHVDVAEFVKSSVGFEDCPGNGEPEFALVGRSNVGKSSLLNSLVRRKKLALTSKKPGQIFD